MNEGLVAEIVRQILADPRFKQMMTETGGLDKPKLLVLSEDPQRLEGFWESIIRKWGASFTLNILDTGITRFELPEGVTWITEDEASVTEWKRLILPTCSVSNFVRIALGLRDDTISNYVGRALLKRIPVEINEPDFGFTPNTPITYKQLYEGYTNQLRSYGVQIQNSCWDTAHTEQVLPHQEGNSSLRDDSQHLPVIEKQVNIIQFDKKLLAEKDALALPLNSILKVTQKTVISPLAKDVLRIRKIELDRNGEAFSCF